MFSGKDSFSCAAFSRKLKRRIGHEHGDLREAPETEERRDERSLSRARSAREPRARDAFESFFSHPNETKKKNTARSRARWSPRRSPSCRRAQESPGRRRRRSPRTRRARARPAAAACSHRRETTTQKKTREKSRTRPFRTSRAPWRLGLRFSLSLSLFLAMKNGKVASSALHDAACRTLGVVLPLCREARGHDGRVRLRRVRAACPRFLFGPFSPFFCHFFILFLRRARRAATQARGLRAPRPLNVPLSFERRRLVAPTIGSRAFVLVRAISHSPRPLETKRRSPAHLVEPGSPQREFLADLLRFPHTKTPFRSEGRVLSLLCVGESLRVSRRGTRARTSSGGGAYLRPLSVSSLV